MTAIDEGVIKYACEFIPGEIVAVETISSLMQWRDFLHALGLIGTYENGIGFGNISIRIANSIQFIISGTQTGHIAKLPPEYYTVVTDFDIEKNHLTCRGPIKASSESLTHAAIYSQQPNINAIIHVHHSQLWKQLLGRVPTTHQDVPYGTPEMAQEIFRLLIAENLREQKILVMSGHQDGCLTFGKNLTEAGQILIRYYSQLEDD